MRSYVNLYKYVLRTLTQLCMDPAYSAVLCSAVFCSVVLCVFMMFYEFRANLLFLCRMGNDKFVWKKINLDGGVQPKVRCARKSYMRWAEEKAELCNKTKRSEKR